MPRNAGKPIVMEKLDFRQKKAAPGGRVPQVQPDAVLFQLWKSQGLLYLPRAPAGSGNPSGQPRPSVPLSAGSSSWNATGSVSTRQAALVLARRFLGCSERVPRLRVCPVGNGVHVAFTVPARKRVEARVDLLGCCTGAAETGACSTTPAGEAETPTQSGSGCRGGRGPWDGLSGDSSVFPGESPGRSRLALLGRQRGVDRVSRNG